MAARPGQPVGGGRDRRAGSLARVLPRGGEVVAAAPAPSSPQAEPARSRGGRVVGEERTRVGAVPVAREVDGAGPEPVSPVAEPRGPHRLARGPPQPAGPHSRRHPPGADPLLGAGLPGAGDAGAVDQGLGEADPGAAVGGIDLYLVRPPSPTVRGEAAADPGAWLRVVGEGQLKRSQRGRGRRPQIAAALPRAWHRAGGSRRSFGGRETLRRTRSARRRSARPRRRPRTRRRRRCRGGARIHRGAPPTTCRGR